MTAKKLPRFDVATLKRLAGGAFLRGEAYHREGRVEILAVEPRRVLAQVTGTEDYRVNLLGRGETIKGECTCPAFDDSGFCKHMAATALAANVRQWFRDWLGDSISQKIERYLPFWGKIC